MIRKTSGILLICICLSGIQAKIPDYIQTCKRSDPKINECIIKSIENLRPKLKEGIPELNVPALEPLHLDEVVVSDGELGFVAKGSNVSIEGMSNFEILSLEADPNNNLYKIGVRFPQSYWHAFYEIDTKVGQLHIKGKGDLHVNATDIEGVGIVKGHKEAKEDKAYLKIDSVDLKVKVKKYRINVNNLFNGDKALEDAMNVFLNQNSKEMSRMVQPLGERTASKIIIDIANKITNSFEYDELFPQ